MTDEIMEFVDGYDSASGVDGGGRYREEGWEFSCGACGSKGGINLAGRDFTPYKSGPHTTHEVIGIHFVCWGCGSTWTMELEFYKGFCSAHLRQYEEDRNEHVEGRHD